MKGRRNPLIHSKWRQLKGGGALALGGGALALGGGALALGGGALALGGGALALGGGALALGGGALALGGGALALGGGILWEWNPIIWGGVVAYFCKLNFTITSQTDNHYTAHLKGVWLDLHPYHHLEVSRDVCL